ncbi:hypothetical protein [Bacilliculturomica massiliensis]|uniref:hypothetical protein n=1 Tax=Bacilliculturomica massiliensis TaxID=1917867 RepID=UPI0010321F19|nr:hypothetical protein [Bacilliculturomica massiliensis]
MKKRRSLFVIVMCVVLLFSTTAAFAADLDVKVNGVDDTRTIGSGSVSFTRADALRGKAIYSASSFSTNVEYIKATVTVERKYSSGWDQYYAPYEVYGNSRTGEIDVVEYIDVNASGTYRIKVVFEDKVNGVVNRTSGRYSSAISL